MIPAGGVAFDAQTTADFNGDGIPDLVTASTGQVQLGLGDGRFGDPTTLPFPVGAFGTPSGNTVAAVDADGNGTTDILVGGSSVPAGQAEVFFNSSGDDNRTAGAVAFVVSAPARIAGGDDASVTITAVDTLGNPVPGFLGTVDLDFTTPGSTALNLAGQYTFTADDAGRHMLVFSNVSQPGATAFSVFAVGMPTATASVNVVPGVIGKFAFSTPASIAAGSPFSFTITAEDSFGNVKPDYTARSTSPRYRATPTRLCRPTTRSPPPPARTRSRPCCSRRPAHSSTPGTSPPAPTRSGRSTSRRWLRSV